jgi:hypothetical protein
MNSVKIKLIREGMVTATEVKDRTGRTLLASGKTITSKHLKVLKTWGITEINIMSSKESPSDSEQIDKIIPVDPSIIKEMDKLFQFTDRRHPVVSEFYNLCLTRKTKEDV